MEPSIPWYSLRSFDRVLRRVVHPEPGLPSTTGQEERHDQFNFSVNTCKGRTKHLARLHNALKAGEDIADWRVARLLDTGDDVHRIEH